MAPSEQTSVGDSTVPVAETDPLDGMPPVTLPAERIEEDPEPPGRSDVARSDASGRTDPDTVVRRRGSRPQRRPGRRVVRIVRHVQLWSVFKVALLGGLVFYVIFLIAAGLGWSIANATGQIHHVEQFMRQIGFDNWTFNGAQLFRAAALLGAILLVAGSVLVTLGAAIVNLIAEATGGVRFTVIEVVDSHDGDDDPADTERPDSDG